MKYLIGYIPSEVDAARDILPYVMASEEIDGVEVNFSASEATEWLDYNISLAEQLTSMGKVYQVHLPVITQESLFVLGQLKDLVPAAGGRINAVVHHALGQSVDEDLVLTVDMLDQIYDYLHKNDLNVDVHLENLNVIGSLDIFPEESHEKWRPIVGRERININRIDEILGKYPSLKLCLDVGHVIADKLDFRLTTLQKERVGNIHIHDADERSDHRRNGSCTDIRLTDAFVKSVFNLENYRGYGVIEVAKVHLGSSTAESINILEKEIRLIKGKHYSDIVFTDGVKMERDKALEICAICGASAGEYHQSYCEQEICPLCGKYLKDCNHMEGYHVEISK
ncbi:MAG: hypothetical protein JXO44_12805 [Clostridia bacterium]|nr:hypothetical protein [Clostridia bacterium]